LVALRRGQPLRTDLYYFSDRRFAGGQPNVGPGNCSTEEEQIEMVDRLSREDVALVIDIPGFAVDSLETRRIERFAPILWRYLGESFKSPGTGTTPHVNDFNSYDRVRKLRKQNGLELSGRRECQVFFQLSRTGAAALTVQAFSFQ
jgi:hypothetical protein